MQIDGVNLITLRRNQMRTRMQLQALLQSRRDDVTDFDSEHARLVRKLAAYRRAIRRLEKES